MHVRVGCSAAFPPLHLANQMLSDNYYDNTRGLSFSIDIFMEGNESPKAPSILYLIKFNKVNTVQ